MKICLMNKKLKVQVQLNLLIIASNQNNKLIFKAIKIYYCKIQTKKIMILVKKLLLIVIINAKLFKDLINKLNVREQRLILIFN